MAKKKAANLSNLVVPSRKTEAVQGPDLPTFYVNNINIDLSSFDVRFRLGQIQGATDEAVQVKEVAYVFMSHSHFRALVTAINTSAEKLDKLPPPVPPETQKTH
jgi:hypothetical protein